jgi:hypothetical protein
MKDMRGKTHFKSIIIPAFLVAMVLSAIMSSQAFSVTYKVIDLNPSGFSNSYAYGTNGTQQVGRGDGHALLWSGSADSFIDLHQFLPTGFASSGARGIDSCGNIVGYATDNLGYDHAILWQVPEPATLLLLSLGAAFLKKPKN